MPDDNPDLDVGLPRSQGGSRPQHMIETMLYSIGTSGRYLPSAALVDLAGDFGWTPRR